ncbi:MAG: hypothetical protein EOM68_04080 [Spirochaetia bacterium]|nr:hypothetical protein [Spirochaetia bacterium]
MLKKFLAALCIGLLSLGTLFAVSDFMQALPGLDAAAYQSLEKGEILDAETVGGGQITQLFVPGTVASSRSLVAQKAENGFSIAAVSYIPFGPRLKGMDTPERQLTVFNAIRAISTQEGLMYISHRAGNKPKVLIEKSSYMEDEKNLNKLLDDPIATVFPRTVQSYVFQRDSSFGGNRYLHTYTNSDREIFVEITNISAIKVFGIFTAVPKEKMSISMATYLLDDGLLLMALTTIEDRDPKISVLGISVDLPSSFLRRITALQEWFVGQLEAVEGK